MKKRTGDRPFIDTNVIVYAFGEGDPRKDVARALLADGGVTGVQMLNEFVAVARRKLRMSWKEISAALEAIRVLCPLPVPITIEIHEAALQISERHRYSIFDALVIAAALATGCGTLYSEDMQGGQVIEGLTIRNPFLQRA